MKTQSVMIQNLIVPCANRCRHCLLSWDGRPLGVPWERGEAFARRFRDSLAASRPGLKLAFSFGYSMDHPALPEALRFLREIGSPQAEYLQCDGLRMRTETECRAFAALLAEEGVRQLNFTVYGPEDYHDRFAARQGDFALILRMMEAAAEAELAVSAGILLTEENAPGAEALYRRLSGLSDQLFFFIPHEEGRGLSLDGVRLRERSLALLGEDAQDHLNRRFFRPEREWIAEPESGAETRRMLLLSLTPDSLPRYEDRDAGELIAGLEALDEAYYAAFPSFAALAERYGARGGDRLYSRRDLFARYRRLYRRDHPLDVYDVTDERFSGSRRY